MAYPSRRSRTLGSTLPAIQASALALGLGAPPRARAGEWTLSLQPLYLTISGHDPHFLTVHEIDRDAASVEVQKRAVLLETGNGPAYRGELEYDTGRWAWGFDVFWFSTTQKAADRSAFAGGAIDEVVFEVADRSFTSTGPSEVLFYRRLEDTDVALWTADLRATRTLAETTAGPTRPPSTSPWARASTRPPGGTCRFRPASPRSRTARRPSTRTLCSSPAPRPSSSGGSSPSARATRSRVPRGSSPRPADPC